MWLLCFLWASKSRGIASAHTPCVILRRCLPKNLSPLGNRGVRGSNVAPELAAEESDASVIAGRAVVPPHPVLLPRRGEGTSPVGCARIWLLRVLQTKKPGMNISKRSSHVILRRCLPKNLSPLGNRGVRGSNVAPELAAEESDASVIAGRAVVPPHPVLLPRRGEGTSPLGCAQI